MLPRYATRAVMLLRGARHAAPFARCAMSLARSAPPLFCYTLARCHADFTLLRRCHFITLLPPCANDTAFTAPPAALMPAARMMPITMRDMFDATRAMTRRRSAIPPYLRCLRAAPCHDAFYFARLTPRCRRHHHAIRSLRLRHALYFADAIRLTDATPAADAAIIFRCC